MWHDGQWMWLLYSNAQAVIWLGVQRHMSCDLTGETYVSKRRWSSHVGRGWLSVPRAFWSCINLKLGGYNYNYVWYIIYIFLHAILTCYDVLMLSIMMLIDPLILQRGVSITPPPKKSDFFRAPRIPATNPATSESAATLKLLNRRNRSWGTAGIFQLSR